MNIREANITDVPQLSSLINGAYRGESSRKGWTTEADLLGGIRTNEASLTAMLNKPQAGIALAEEAELLGCVYLEKQEESMYLGMLTVLPHLQGKGIGAALMNYAEKKATAADCSKIQMTVITVRTELIAYYQRKGYQDTGIRKPFPADPEFGVPKQPLEFMVMEKIL